jgi:hypothetical protein
MLTILKYRVLFITILFGAFGGALSLLLKIEDLKNYYPSLAVLIALAVTLLVSFLIKAKWTRQYRNKLKVAATLLFVLFLGAVFFHTYYIINHTFEYREFDKMSRYVKGEYSETGLSYKKNHPYQRDEEALRNYFGGPSGIELLWTKDSINNNIFRLIISYCCLVMFFVGCISFLTEILADKYFKSIKKVHTGT